MYAILSGGELLALCDKPRYVRKHERTGVYVEAAAEDAIAVAVRGELYNIGGQNAVPDAPDAVVVRDDIAEYVFRNKAHIERAEADAGAAIVEVENALCDVDMATETRLADIENALCDMDMGGEK